MQRYRVFIQCVFLNVDTLAGFIFWHYFFLLKRAMLGPKFISLNKHMSQKKKTFTAFMKNQSPLFLGIREGEEGTIYTAVLFTEF